MVLGLAVAKTDYRRERVWDEDHFHCALQGVHTRSRTFLYPCTRPRFQHPDDTTPTTLWLALPNVLVHRVDSFSPLLPPLDKHAMGGKLRPTPVGSPTATVGGGSVVGGTPTAGRRGLGAKNVHEDESGRRETNRTSPGGGGRTGRRRSVSSSRGGGSAARGEAPNENAEKPQKMKLHNEFDVEDFFKTRLRVQRLQAHGLHASAETVQVLRDELKERRKTHAAVQRTAAAPLLPGGGGGGVPGGLLRWSAAGAGGGTGNEQPAPAAHQGGVVDGGGAPVQDPLFVQAQRHALISCRAPWQGAVQERAADAESGSRIGLVCPVCGNGFPGLEGHGVIHSRSAVFGRKKKHSMSPWYLVMNCLYASQVAEHSIVEQNNARSLDFHSVSSTSTMRRKLRRTRRKSRSVAWWNRIAHEA